MSIRFILIMLWLSQVFGSNESIRNIETAGDILQISLPVVALGSTYLLDDDEGRSQFWSSYISSISITYFLKLSIDKIRPNGDCCESFPSGHTTAAFSGAMFIQRKYGYKYGIPSLLMSSFVGYSRIQADKHYLEDVVVGAWIGVLGNLIFTDRYKSNSFSFYKYRDNFNFNLSLDLK